MVLVTEKLIPAKFLFLMSNLFLFIVVSYTKDNNIFAGISDSAVYGSDEYNKAKQSVLACAALGIIALVIELVLMISGATLFFNQVSALRKS